MEVEFFNSLEEVQARLRQAMEAADARVRPWQAAVKVGDCFIADGGEDDLLVFGEVLEGYREAHLRHYRFCRCFSVACPEGEVGDTHVSTVLCLVSRAFFEAMRQAGWQTEAGQQPRPGCRTTEGDRPPLTSLGEGRPHRGQRRAVRAGTRSAEDAGPPDRRPELAHSAFRPSGRPCEAGIRELPRAWRATGGRGLGTDRGMPSAARCWVLLKAILRMRNADGSLSSWGPRLAARASGARWFPHAPITRADSLSSLILPSGLRPQASMR